ncbi:MAG: AI-2E family transporter [Ruminococcus sp.]|nr:AI-2E family transporter [Ruminococcus sp.]
MNNNKKNNRSFYQALMLVAFGVLLYWGLNKYKTVEHWLAVFAEIFASFVLGCIIALVLDVPMSFFERKLFGEPALGESRGRIKHKIARPVSILLTFVGVGGLVTLVLALLIPSIKETAVQLYQQVPDFINRAFKLATSNPTLNEYIKKSGLSATKVITMITDKIQDGKFLSNTLSGMINFASGTLTTLVNFLIGLVFAIYMLSQKETLKDQMTRICKAYLPAKAAGKAVHIAVLSKTTFSNFISGQSLEALILGSLCMTGMSILRLPYAATIGVLVAVTAFIPIVGAFLGIAIGAFLILITSLKQAVVFIVFMVILQQIEGNLIYPRVVGKSVGLPSLWVLFAITVGGSVGGIMGMFLAVPVMSVLYCLIRDSVDSRNARKASVVPYMKDDLSDPPDWLTGKEVQKQPEKPAAAAGPSSEEAPKPPRPRRRRRRKPAK